MSVFGQVFGRRQSSLRSLSVKLSVKLSISLAAASVAIGSLHWRSGPRVEAMDGDGDSTAVDDDDGAAAAAAPGVLTQALQHYRHNASLPLNVVSTPSSSPPLSPPTSPIFLTQPDDFEGSFLYRTANGDIAGFSPWTAKEVVVDAAPDTEVGVGEVRAAPTAGVSSSTPIRPAVPPPPPRHLSSVVVRPSPPKSSESPYFCYRRHPPPPLREGITH